MYGPFIRHRRGKFTPDWLHLASVRLLCEQGILEHSNDVLKQLTELDRLRPGSWATGLGNSSQIANTSETSQNKDWAGVEGVWRQLVIWMGYEALVEFQHDKNNYSLVEHRSTHIVVPLYLHVVSYEDDPHGSPLFPIIHFEGQIGGEGWHVDPEPQHGLDIHPVEGKVCMLSDGSVRWSLISYTDIAKKEKEWRSEGVQIGGIGSMAGVLGTWTGADYDPDDPIGGWWRWKVA
ncbi:hypothetical protein QCA50_014328 [Cerrena zonata]|uniref:Uncharacterized protein n=1 Tax=Cerrena zonata TaxID=2478898 RepID=A0AAW0FNF4_9APHY